MHPITRKEIRDAVRNRWVIGYAAILATLGFAAAWFGIKTAGGMAIQIFGRTTATVTNLSLLVAPLVALILGASSIAAERDNGTLRRLLAQPITPGELLWSKYAGLMIALGLATLIGFTPAALMVAVAAGVVSLAHFLIFPMITILLIAAMTAVGFVITATARGVSKALGSAVMAWFAFVVLYDLLLIGSLVVASMSPKVLIALVIANPVDALRILVVLALEPDLHALGPAGVALVSTLGWGGAAALLGGVPLLWTAAAIYAARRLFNANVFAASTRRATQHTVSTQISYALADAPPTRTR